MSGFSTLASYAFTALFTFILSKFGQRFVWGNKKVDGTNKSPWAPSPSGLPFITKGYSEFQQNTYHALTKWYQQLGDFFTVQLGFKRIIVLNTPELVREALIEKQQLNSSRLPSDTFERMLTDHCKTVYSAPFETYWSRLRRSIYIVVGKIHVSQFNKFFKEQAKKFSFGIQESNKGKLTAKELRQLVDMIALDSALTLVFGPQSSHDPVAMLTLLQKLQELESLQTRKYNRIGQFFPVVNSGLDLKNLFTLNSTMVNLKNGLLETVWPWFEPIYQLRGDDRPLSEEERRKALINNNGKIDAIAKALLFVEPSKNDPEPVQLTKDEILSNSVHITLHAYTYLSSALFTLVQRLASEPELQEQLLSADDTFYRAFVNESLRLDTPTQILAYAPRTDYDFEVEGKSYRVDEDTPLVVNVHAIHRNERYYPQPTVFDPQRFMKVDKKTTPLLEVDQTGKKTARDHLAFGAGRRVCIGSKASEDFLVATLVQLVKQYRLKGGDVSEKVEHATNVWAWTGRTETKGASIEFEKRT